VWSAEAKLPPDADDGAHAVRPYTPPPPRAERGWGKDYNDRRRGQKNTASLPHSV
jgi:hypothetical protein